MLSFGWIECCERCQLGHQWGIPDLARGDVVHDRLRDLFLFVVMIKDDRTILRADIVALTIQGRGIMDGEEHLQKITK